MKVYAIRHKPTGIILSDAYQTGATHWNPWTDRSDSPPRLFHSARAAKRCAACWCQGAQFKGQPPAEWMLDIPETHYGLRTVSDPRRKPEDIEIVTYFLRETHSETWEPRNNALCKQ
jgi:hypothetical protein